MHNILFLDIDGVLNCIGTKERSPHGTYGIAADKAAWLRDVINKTGCKIVLSSTWRRWPDMIEHVKKVLSLTEDGFLGCTPIPGRSPLSELAPGARRGDEITAWLHENLEKVSHYVVVDDDSDVEAHFAHFVKTKVTEGLTPARAQEIIDKFNDTDLKERWNRRRAPHLIRR